MIGLILEHPNPIIGTTVIVRIGGVTTFRQTITQEFYDGSAITPGLASIGIIRTGSSSTSIMVHSILVYNGEGEEISSTGTPTMSSISVNERNSGLKFHQHGLLSVARRRMRLDLYSLVPLEF